MKRWIQKSWLSQTKIRVLSGVLLAAVGGLLPLGGLAPAARASTGVNSQINYQARLLNSAGATVPDGNYNIEFKIYQDGTGCVSSGSSPCGGTLKWTEDWLNNNSQGVTVTNGYLSVMLGAGSDSAALASAVDFNQSSLWLSVNIGNTNTSCASFAACGGDGEMLPFTRFAAAPYAINAGQLDGLASSSFAQLNASQTLTGANILQPTTDITPLAVKQTSGGGTPTSDIFDVQTANGSYILRATSTTSNSSAVTLASIGGTNALNLTGAGAVTITGHAASTWDIGANTLSLQTTSNGAITTGTGTLTAGGSLVVQGTGNALSVTSSPSASTTQSLLDLGVAIASGSSNGTFIGVNTSGAYSGDLINLEVAGTSQFLVSGAGDIRQGGGVSIYNTGSSTPSTPTFSATLTVTDLLTERMVAANNNTGVAQTLTTPSAASIVAAIPYAKIGDNFTFVITNGGGKQDTLAGGSGVTINSAAPPITTNSAITFLCRLTNVTGGSQAVTCY